MTRHRTREVADLAGVSEASVDRVVHARGTTRPKTLAAVRAAIAELDRRKGGDGAGRREPSIEAIVVDEPFRARLIRDALDQVLPRLRPQVVETIVHVVPSGRPDLAAAALAQVHSRRPQGVLVDLEEDPSVVEQAASLLRAGTPVVTINRPFPQHASLGHSGLDNRAAGATAAYLIGRSQPVGATFAVAHGTTLTPVEQDRVTAFTAVIEDLHPGATVTSFAIEDAGTLDLRNCRGVYVVDPGAAGATSFPLLRKQMSPTATLVGHRDADLLAQVAMRVFDFALEVSWEAVVGEGCSALLAYHQRGLSQVQVSPTPPFVLTPFNLIA